MKFYRLLILLLIFKNLNGIAIAQPVIQWQKTFGGSENDKAKSIIITEDNGFAIFGSSESSNGDVSNHHSSTGLITDDFWLIRLDSLGSLQWNNSYGGKYDEDGKSIIQTMDGGYVMVGRTSSNDGDVSGNHGVGSDYWIIKTDSVGNLLWQKCFGGIEEEEASQVIPTQDSGFLIVGTWNSNNISQFHGNFDVAVHKLNQHGVQEWAKCYGGSSSDYGLTCKQTIDGSYVIVGETISNDGNVNGLHGIHGDIWVFKIDSIGTLKWQRCYGGTSVESPGEIIVLDDGSFFLTGYTLSEDDDVTDSIGGADYWLVKIDSVGNILWDKCFGGQYDEVLKHASATSDGGLIMTGLATSDDGMVSGTHGLWDYWFVKVDSAGNFQWGKSVGGTNHDRATSILETPDGGYIAIGYTESNDGDITSNHGKADYWIVKLAPLGLSIPEIENTLMDLNIFQNNGQLNIRFFSKKNENALLRLYDINGKRIIEKNISVNEGINYNYVNCSGIAKGLYFIKVNSEKGSQGNKVLIE